MTTRELAYRTDILEGLRMNALDDGDIFTVADALVAQFGELLDVCDLKTYDHTTEAEREYTRVLVNHFVLYRAGVNLRMGGSRCDYSAYAAAKAVNGYVLHLDGSEKAQGILGDIRKNIAELEWEPEFALKLEDKVGMVLGDVA